MLKKMAKTASLALALATLPGSASAAMGPDAAACRAGATGPAVLAYVDGFKARSTVWVSVMAPTRPGSSRAANRPPGQLPVTPAGRCVSLLRRRYAIAVRHDQDGNGRSGWSDGGGFSRNPRLSLTSLRPSFDNVVFSVGERPTPINVLLNYRFGLSVHPVRG
jgi:uncharacterized protein (DUF2141 family)